jgi:hypothetical protein
MKKRIQVSINPDLIAAAREIMARRKFDSLSEFLEYLIRSEWEKRHTPSPVAALNDAAAPKPAPEPITYKRRKRSRNQA